ncbi:MAG: hypothetical protein AMXMBFR84_26230 [Candidatus Hydrogenedentota bacterium]
MQVDPHTYVLKNGRHAGKVLTHVPVDYLKWMVNIRHTEAAAAQTELERRGTVTPDLDISGHAIDRASMYLLDFYRVSRLKDEGLHAWLVAISGLALNHGKRKPGEQGDLQIKFCGIKFCFAIDCEWPVLKTVNRVEKEDKGRSISKLVKARAGVITEEGAA